MNALQTGGLVGAMPGVIGTLQALEVIKLIVGKGRVLKERLLIFDGLTTKFRRIKVRRNPQCPVCGEHPGISSVLEQDYGEGQSRGLFQTSSHPWRHLSLDDIPLQRVPAE